MPVSQANDNVVRLWLFAQQVFDWSESAAQPRSDQQQRIAPANTSEQRSLQINLPVVAQPNTDGSIHVENRFPIPAVGSKPCPNRITLLVCHLLLVLIRFRPMIISNASTSFGKKQSP